jgi:hypothetical protein
MGSLHAGRRMRATAIAVLALIVVPVALAVEKQPRRLNAADQAAAKAATLKLSDFAAGTGWKGGAVKPDLTSDSKCVSKVSDLVITGNAKSEFNAAAAAMRITSETEVLESAAMVTADWQRTVGNAAFMACTRKEYSQLEAGFKVISFTKLAFPKLTRYTARYRVLADVETQDGRLRVLVDLILLGQSRNETTLVLSAPYVAHAAVDAAERRLAQTLVSRMRG